MTDIIFSFDTEDFTSQRASDAIVSEAGILRSEGIRGCFCVVGLLAKQLKEWKRMDVAEALKYHEIDFHTFGHTYHPMIDEYTDTDDFDEAYTRCADEESKGIEYVRDFFGRDKIYAAVPPGNQKNYAAMYAYADMGISVYADTVCDPYNGRGMYYCDIYHIEYVRSLESFLLEWDDNEVKRFVGELASRPRAVIYTHPNVAVAKTWWDIDNYDKENLVPYGEWNEAEKRPEDETQAFYRNIRRFIRILKNDGRFRFSTYSEQAEKLDRRPQRVIRRNDMTQIRRIAETLFPEDGDYSISLADAFLACIDFLNGKNEHVCGRTKGFLETPYAVKTETILSKRAVAEAAKNIDVNGFLPSSIKVGDETIGPADFLRAAVRALDGEEIITVFPAEQMPCLDFLPELRDMTLKGTWRHSDSFEDKYISERLRLQSWTMRF